MDDFLFIAKTKEQCARDLQNLILMCDYLGVPLAPEKTVGHDTVLQFTGITLDSVLLQSLIGLLNFTCTVVAPGRAFLCQLIDLTKGIQKPHHHIRLSKGAKSDILIWLRFLEDFNGKSFFFNDIWETSHTLHLYTDAAGSIGFGAVFGCHWLHGI